MYQKKCCLGVADKLVHNKIVHKKCCSYGCVLNLMDEFVRDTQKNGSSKKNVFSQKKTYEKNVYGPICPRHPSKITVKFGPCCDFVLRALQSSYYLKNIAQEHQIMNWPLESYRTLFREIHMENPIQKSRSQGRGTGGAPPHRPLYPPL